jgi:hypothetical protein
MRVCGLYHGVAQGAATEGAGAYQAAGGVNRELREPRAKSFDANFTNLREFLERYVGPTGLVIFLMLGSTKIALLTELVPASRKRSRKKGS